MQNYRHSYRKTLLALALSSVFSITASAALTTCPSATTYTSALDGTSGKDRLTDGQCVYVTSGKGVSPKSGKSVTGTGSVFVITTGSTARDNDAGVFVSSNTSANFEDLTVSTTGIGRGVYALQDSDAKITVTGNLTIDTQGFGSDALVAAGGAIMKVKDVFLTTNGDDAKGIVISSKSSTSGTSSSLTLNSSGLGSFITTYGKTSDAIYVVNASEFVIDHTNNFLPATISLLGSDSAVLNAYGYTSAPAKITVSNTALNMAMTGSASNNNFGIRSESGAVIYLTTSSDTGGTAITATTGSAAKPSFIYFIDNAKADGSKAILGDYGILDVGGISASDFSIGSLDGTLSSAEVRLGTHILNIGVNNTAGDGSLNPDANFAGKITGVGNLIKLGASKQTLSGNNSYVGDTIISDGTLAITSTGTYSGRIDVQNGAVLQTDIAANIFINASNTIVNGTWQLLGDKAQTANKLSGSGAIELDGNADFTAQNTAAITDDTIFTGIISGTGSLHKTGLGKLTLSGDNSYTGSTTITAGNLLLTGKNSSSLANIDLGTTLQIGNGVTTGSFTGDALDNGTLIFNRSDNLTYAGNLSGSGDLIQNGAGALTLNGAGSKIDGSVTLNNGSLIFNTGDAFGAGHYQSTAAITTLNDNSTLDVVNEFNLDADSTLNVTVKDINPLISAASADISGSTLNVSGFSPASVSSASQLASSYYQIIHTTGGITGDFINNPVSGSSSPDYIVTHGYFANGRNDYNIGSQLAWTDGGDAKANGRFTIDSGNFNVDVVLADQTPVASFTSGWDGRSLTKSGAGILTLSEANTYTGKTSVDAGTLLVTKTGTYSGSLEVKAGASLQTDTDADIFINAANTQIDGTWQLLGDKAQTANKLSGSGKIELGNAELSVQNTTAVTDDTTFAGIISGAGGLHKTGSGTLTLTGDNSYTGSTTITAGNLLLTGKNSSSLANIDLGTTLQIGNGGTTGSFTGDALDNGTLIFNRSDNLTYAGNLSGSGDLIQNGAGALTLNGAGSKIDGSITLNNGSLIFNAGDAFGAGHYQSTAAITTLNDNSTLDVVNEFNLDADSSLNVTVKDINPLISAASADISGSTLNISGFSPASVSSASQLASSYYQIIHTTGGITGDFINNPVSGASSPDYIVTHGYFANGRNDYNIGSQLAWTDGGDANANGSFSIDSGNFNVDVLLADQTPVISFTSYWDGQSLTKSGAGILTLSEANTYTGKTSVDAGTLLVNKTGTYSGSLEVKAGASLQTDTDADIFINAANTQIDGTWQLLGGQAQTANKLSGSGTIELGNAELSAQNATAITDDTTFAGIISGTGGLHKTGSGTLTLTGDSTYTGITNIDAGSTLQFGDGTSSDGNIQSNEISNSGILIANHKGINHYSGNIYGSGLFIKKGLGEQVFDGDVSGIGDIDVQAGVLMFKNKGDFTVNNNYTTQAAAATAVGRESAQINIKGTFEQKDNSALMVVLSDDSSRVLITADSTNLSGVLDVQGFDADAPNLSSEITHEKFIIIKSTNLINGDFSSGGVSADYKKITGATSSDLDYLLKDGHIDPTGYLYEMGFRMAWTSGEDDLATGNFTIEEGTSFNIDSLGTQPLVDQSPIVAFASGWDGKSLTKLGLGKLTLSDSTIAYTGATTVTEGTLAVIAAGADSYKGDLDVQSNGILQTYNSANIFANTANISIDGDWKLFDDAGNNGQEQIANNLKGSGTIELGAAKLTANNVTDSSFGGVISGTGTLEKTGSGTLTLTAKNIFTGDTTISEGTLQLGDGGDTGSVSGNIIDNASLVFNRGDDLDYVSKISGTGSFIKRGSGRLGLNNTGSIIGSVSVEDGILELSRQNADSTLTVAGDYHTADYATTKITGHSDTSTLVVGGDFQQDSEAILEVTISAANMTTPAITAYVAHLNDSTLNIDGFSVDAPTTASEVESKKYWLIHTTSTQDPDDPSKEYGIFDGFWNSDKLVPSAGGMDYLLQDGYLSADYKDYFVGFRLAWTEGSTEQANGDFTVAAGTEFIMDQPLENRLDVELFRADNEYDWDGQSLRKQGDGILVLAAENTYDGKTTVDGGILRTDVDSAFAKSSDIIVNNGGTLDLNGHSQTVNRLSDTDGIGGIITLNGANIIANNAASAVDDSTFNGEISGNGNFIKTGAGRLTLTGKTDWIGETDINGGALILDGSKGGAQLTGKVIAKEGVDTHFILENGATFTGTVDPVTMVVGQGSTFNVAGNSIVNTLTEAGTIVFISNGVPGKILTVNGDFVGQNGLIQINTTLEDDNSPSSHIMINGDANGTARILVNQVGGSGAETNNGIQVINVAGASNAQFTLEGRAVAGAYEYSLNQNSADGNWYLNSQAPTPTPPNPGPNPNPTPNPIYRPEVGAYVANQIAANGLFVSTLHERLGESMYESDVPGCKTINGSVWARINGGTQDSEVANGQVDISAQNSLVQVGTDLIKWNNDKSRVQAGVMFSGGQSNSVEHAKYTKAQAHNKLNGYAFGLYATWYGSGNQRNEGIYVDSWLQYGRYDNTVEGDDLPKQQYDSHNWLASLEAGYAIALSKNPHNIWYFEPQVQAIYSNYSQDDINEANGTQVKAENTNNLFTRLGARFYARGALKNGMKFKPFAEFNWLHNQHAAAVSMGSSLGETTISSDMPDNRGEIKFGLEGELNKHLNIWGHVGYQQGSHGYRQTEGNIGIKYLW